MKKEKIDITEAEKNISEKDVGFLDDALGFIEAAEGAFRHAVSSFVHTQDPVWRDIAKEIRRDRSKILESITPKSESELYCYSKHTSRMVEHAIEIANRFNEAGENEIAKEWYIKSQKYEKTIKFLIEKYKEEKNGI